MQFEYAIDPRNIGEPATIRTDGRRNVVTTGESHTFGASTERWHPVNLGSAAPITDITSDEWKLQFFTSLTSPDADPNADPDHDGVPNWAEYLAGTDPTNAASRLMFNPITTQMHGGQRQVVLSWFSAPGKVYEVQAASTPTSGSWSVIKPVSGNGDTVTALDINPSGPRYYRLRVLP